MPLSPFLVLAGYWLILVYQLGAQWSLYEQYHYGWAVPFLCLYLIARRAQVAERRAPSAEHGAESEPSIRPRSSTAVVLLCVVLFLLLPVRVLHEANPIWRLTSLAWTLILVTATLLLLWLAGGRPWLRQFAAPTCFFLVAVPWPTPLETAVTQTLMRLNVGITVDALTLLGVSALQRGNVIELGTGLVGIEEACSGIRSFQATLMLGLFFGILYRLPWRRMLGLVLSGLALSFLFNVVRTSFLSLVAARKGTAAIAAWHDSAGVAILLACFVLLWLMARGMRDGGKRRAQSGERRAESGESRGESGEIEQGTKGPKVPRSFSLLVPWSFGPFTLSLLVWLVVVEGGTQLWFRAHEQPEGATATWSIHWPRDNPSFQRVDLSPEVRAMLRFDEGQSGRWRAPDGSAWQVFALDWRPAHSLYDRVRVSLTKSHNPEVCLQAAGLKLRAELAPLTLRLAPDLPLNFRRYVFEADGQPIHVFFSVAESMRPGASPGFLRMTHWDRLRAALAGSRNYGQHSLEIAISGLEDPAQAQAALQRALPSLISVQAPHTP